MLQAVIVGATAMVCVGLVALFFNERAQRGVNRHTAHNGNTSHCYAHENHRNRAAKRPVLDECVICMERKPEIEIYPCGHRIMCENCVIRLISESKKACPMCRSSIKGYHTIEDTRDNSNKKRK